LSAAGGAGAGSAAGAAAGGVSILKRYVCEQCGVGYSTLAGRSNHKYNCDANMRWRCEWCRCKWHETKNRAPGPSGGGTLCDKCGRSYRTHGHEGRARVAMICGQGAAPHSLGQQKTESRRTSHGGKSVSGSIPTLPASMASSSSHEIRMASRPFDLRLVVPNSEGKYVCDICVSKFASRAGMGNHRVRCVQNLLWRCEWCRCKWHETKNRAPGPSGGGTLCVTCNGQFKNHGITGMYEHPFTRHTCPHSHMLALY
jgi:protein-arginine kinase activator protein McsA